MSAKLTKVGGALVNIPGEKTPALPNVDIDELVLYVVGDRKLNLDVRDAVTAPNLHRSIDDASTIDVSILDPDRVLLRSGRLTRTIDIEIDGLWFRMARVTKDGDSITASFEDRGAAILRRYTTPRKASRSKMTEAQFALSLVNESRRYPLGFYCPELNKKQPIETASRQERDALRQPGVSDGADLKIKGHKANARQLRNIETVLAVAEELKAGERATLAMLVAGIGESEFKSDSVNPTSAAAGVFQLLPSTTAAFGIGARETKAQARQFLTDGFTSGKNGGVGAIPLARKNPGMSPGTIASKVEGSDAGGAFYDKHREEADKILASGGGSSTDSGSFYQPYEYSRGEPQGPKGENTWDALGRMASDRGWRRFIVANTVFYIADEDLYRGRPRALLTEDDDGILGIDFTRETSARLASEATVTCLADRWAAPPGSVVLLEGMGPADGRWLVTDIDRADLFDPETTITLSKPSEEMREARSTLSSRAGGGTGTGDVLDNTYPGSPVPGVRPHAATHETAGLAGYPAYDYMAKAGSPCVSPVNGKVTKLSGTDPKQGPPNGPGGPLGWSVYIEADESSGGKSYFLTHLGSRSVKVGDRVQSGEQIGTVANYEKFGRPDHIHMGVKG